MSDKSYKTMSDNTALKQIGDFIRHHRKVQHLTQQELAVRAGISRSTLSLLERGETVTTAMLIQVLRVLDQLQVLESFAVEQQISPLLLAKAEHKQRQRVRTRRENRSADKVDW